jgi:molecular chaperone DnaK
MVDDNQSLSRFELTGLPPAPRGLPQIEVTFEIDANGILNVSAKDLGTGRKQVVQVVSNSGLSEEDIRRMVRESEDYREEDRMRRDRADLRNSLEGLLYTTDRSLEEYGEALDFDDLIAIREAVQRARDALQGEEVSAMQEAHGKLAEKAQIIANVLYAGAVDGADAMVDAMDEAEAAEASSANPDEGQAEKQDL